MSGPNGLLYGTTYAGGTSGDGTVFQVKPPATVCKATNCYWNETILHSFAGVPYDGSGPAFGNVTFDRSGNIYGTAVRGRGCGTVWELTPANGEWTESLPYTFSLGIDGCSPLTGLVLDTSGNLYGNTNSSGANGNGTVYELTLSNGSWVEQYPGFSEWRHGRG